MRLFREIDVIAQFAFGHLLDPSRHYPAGVLLAESEYRHELEIAIDPFKGLLLGLFFISVGMALNLGVLYTHLLWVAVSVAVLVAVKMLVLYLLARLYGLRSSERMQFAGVLSQGGEFAFVLFSLPASQRLFQHDQMALLLVAVTLSMMTTPLLMKGIDKLLSRRLNPRYAVRFRWWSGT